MNKIYIVILLSIFSSFSYAHSGEDPVKELKKNHIRLSAKHDSFKNLTDITKKIESLQSQANYLQENILILRNLMAKDYPHVTENMSKYKLDYIEELDDSLKEFKETIGLIEDTISE